MARKEKKQHPVYTIDIERLDDEGRGVGHHDGKVVFVEGALPGENVSYECFRNKPKFEIGRVTEIHKESSLRVVPECPNFGIGPGSCGGCAMQHLDATAQVAFKQQVLEDALWHIGKLKAESLLAPIYGPFWHYRHRARLTVRNVEKKGGVLVGFHEKSSSYVADMKQCRILPKKISDMLVPMREFVATLDMKDRMPQIEIAVAGNGHTAMVFRNLDPVTDADMKRLEEFAKTWNVAVWLQPKGPESAYPMNPADIDKLTLHHSEFNTDIVFKPTDFTQVNHALNETMVSRAVRLLDVKPEHKVADFFCGLGNFTLPLARCAAKVTGLEGSEGMVERARAGAAANGLADKTNFIARNLFTWSEDDWNELWNTAGGIDRVLIDPPREGAQTLCQVLAATDKRPARVVYVSCNPATLARDCAILHHEGGWHIRAAGVMNMFPHTGHVESMAVLEPGPKPEKKPEAASEEKAQDAENPACNQAGDDGTSC